MSIRRDARCAFGGFLVEEDHGMIGPQTKAYVVFEASRYADRGIINHALAVV